MRSGLHGHPAKPIPGCSHRNTASHSTPQDADCVCIRVGEQIRQGQIHLSVIEHLTPAILTRTTPGAGQGLPGPLVVGDLRSAVETFERTAIDEALRRAAGNKSRAAKELGISRFALQRKLEKYGLAPGQEAAGLDVEGAEDGGEELAAAREPEEER